MAALISIVLDILDLHDIDSHADVGGQTTYDYMETAVQDALAEIKKRLEFSQQCKQSPEYKQYKKDDDEFLAERRERLNNGGTQC